LLAFIESLVIADQTVCGVRDIVPPLNELRETGMFANCAFSGAKMNLLAKSLKGCAKPALCSRAKLTLSGVESAFFGKTLWAAFQINSKRRHVPFFDASFGALIGL